LDLADFYCRMEFNPEILKTHQIFQGQLFQPAGRRGIILDDSRSEEGILEIRGVSLDKRSGGGMTGSGTLFEVEMDILAAGSSALKIVEFEGVSLSLPEQSVELSGLSHSTVNIYSAQPSIYLNLQPLTSSFQTIEELVPQQKRQVVEGEQFTVYLQVNHVKSMKGLRLDLNFDSNMLELILVEEGDTMNQVGSTLFLCDPLDQANRKGMLSDQGIALLGRGPGTNGPGEIARYLFQAKIPGTAQIRVIQAELVDQKRERKPFQVSSALVEIEIKGR